MIIFAYHFRHRKTIDFIQRCYDYGYKIEMVIAEEKKKLNLPVLPFKYKKIDLPADEPETLCSKLNIPYFVSDHNSNSSIQILNQLKPTIGMIAGARILSKEVINKFSIGIINFHPGIFTEVRGLYSTLKSIKKNKKIMVTSHLIDTNIDAGKIIEKKAVLINPYDSIFDVSHRSYITELDMIKSTYQRTVDNKFYEIDIKKFPYDQSIPFKSIEEFNKSFEKYKQNII